jgi:NAD(P)-dependent dehydrogenase (short-subunit alcohol dehydrogenase family)
MINYFDHENYNVLITGATGYLGRSMALGFASSGATVYVNGRNKNKVNNLVKFLIKKNFKAECAIFDVNNYKSVRKFFIKNKKFHTIVNNGFSTECNDFNFFSKKRFNEALNFSVTSTAFLYKCAKSTLIRGAEENKTASIINILTMYASVSPDPSIYKKNDDSYLYHSPPHYGAAKAGLMHFAKIAAVNLARVNIRVNSISPGPFPNLNKYKDKKFINRLKNKVPMGRVGEPDEIITTALYLSSKYSSFITGANIPIDGGWTAW